MTKEEFIDYVCGAPGMFGEKITRLDIGNSIVIMECNCKEDGCKGWAMVANNAHSIEHQKRFCQNE